MGNKRTEMKLPWFHVEGGGTGPRKLKYPHNDIKCMVHWYKHSKLTRLV